MIIIADGGSTKTNWCLIDSSGKKIYFNTEGYNPYFVSSEYIQSSLKKGLPEDLKFDQIVEVHYYGAGVHNEQKANIIKEAFSAFFTKAEISIGHDLLAAARALLGTEKGFAAILGTGTNTCIYDGNDVAFNIDSAAYILGDEGSGAVLGKLFVSDLLKNQLTPGLKEKFLEQFNLTTGDIIDRVYRKPFPNRFLSTFSPFISENLEDTTVRTLVMTSFKSFLKRNVMQYKNYDRLPIHFVGSVAFHFQEILKEAVEVMNMKPGKIIQSPMEGLIKYHSVADVIL